MVPEDHLVRKLENAIDWRFIYEMKAQMEVKAALTYACMNLKKLAKKRWKTALIPSFLIRYFYYFTKSLAIYSTNPLPA